VLGVNDGSGLTAGRMRGSARASGHTAYAAKFTMNTCTDSPRPAKSNGTIGLVVRPIVVEMHRFEVAA